MEQSFFVFTVSFSSQRGHLVAMPTAEAASLRENSQYSVLRERQRLSLVLTPVKMVKAIFHLGRYNRLAARQRAVILFSGAGRDGVERPRGDGELCKYRSC